MSTVAQSRSPFSASSGLRQESSEMRSTRSDTSLVDGQVVSSPPNTSAVDRAQNSEGLKAVVITFNDQYLRTFPGVVRVVHFICALITLLFVTTSGSSDTADYLSLPMSWRLRVMVFVCAYGLLISLLVVSLHVTLLASMFPIDWVLFDICTYGPVGLLCFVSSSLVADQVHVYHSEYLEATSWTRQQLICAVVFGYLTTALFIIIAGQALRVKLAVRGEIRLQKFALTSRPSSESTCTNNARI